MNDFDLGRAMRTVAADPPPSHIIDLDRAVADGRHRRRLATAVRVTGGALAIAVVAVAGGAVWTATHHPDPAGTIGRVDGVEEVTAADPNHLYAIVNQCPQPHPPTSAGCRLRLVASDNAGRTWHTRMENFDALDIAAHTPTILSRGGFTYDPSRPQPYGTLSTDGGRTWKPVTDTTTPVASVSADGWIESRPTAADPRRMLLWAVDPHQARAAPLAHQPGIELRTDRLADVSPTAGIWVSGRDPATNLGAVAASHDGGRTWSVHVFTDHSTGSLALVATRDGRTAYTVLLSTQQTYVYRSVDGGATWQQRTSVPLPAACQEVGASYIARDGAHVLMVEVAPARFCISRDGGVTYALTDAVTGLHDLFGGIQPVKGGYLARGTDGAFPAASDGIYWSGDGFRFIKLSIR